MKSFAVFIIFFVSGLCLANDGANDYMDNFLSMSFASEVRALGLGRTLLTPDFGFKFEEKRKRPGTVSVEFKNERVEGLDRARRESNCQTGMIAGSIKSMNCTVAFDNLVVEYDGKMKYAKLHKKSIQGRAKFSNIQFFLEIVQPQSKPAVRRFTCIQKGNTTVEVKAPRFLKRFMRDVEARFATQIQDTLFSAMRQKLHYAINRAISGDELEFLFHR